MPYTISASGKYQLGTNLVNANGAQTIISIQAPNVILDLNGFFVSGPGGSTASPFAVIAVADVSNVTIRNGTVANNGVGIAFTGSSTNSINHLVESVNFTRCYLAGVSFGGASPGSIVRNNTFSQIGGSTAAANSDASAILTLGGVRAERNSVATVTVTGSGISYGINAATSDFLIGNTISNSQVGIAGGKYLNNLTSGCTTPFSGGVNAVGNN